MRKAQQAKAARLSAERRERLKLQRKRLRESESLTVSQSR